MLLLLLPQIPQAALLSAALLFRVVYYLVPLAVALLLLAFQEANAARGKLGQGARVAGNWVGRVTPQALGITVFLAGTILVFSGVLPAMTSRLVFANLWTSGAKEELSVDLMRHMKTAPNGIMDYLFTELLLWGKAEGYQTFSLGMSPLSGLEQHPLATLWHKVGNSIWRFGDNFYNFEGLRRYKEKFAPEWSPRYLAAPGGLGMPRALADVAVLISGGLKGVFSK